MPGCDAEQQPADRCDKMTAENRDFMISTKDPHSHSFLEMTIIIRNNGNELHGYKDIISLCYEHEKFWAKSLHDILKTTP